MAVANLANVPTTDAEMAAWSFSHMAHHRDLADYVLQKYGIMLTVYLLDPINTTDAEGFLYQHQTMHNDVDAVLGLDGYDLLGVDWQNLEEREAWIRLNFQSHYAEAEASGVG